MPNEKPDRVASEAAGWAALIAAVAEHGDREAFEALFRHFAPRIKTFMRRSGASDQRADELAAPRAATEGAVQRLVTDEGQAREGEAHEQGNDEPSPHRNPARQENQPANDDRQMNSEPKKARARGAEDLRG